MLGIFVDIENELSDVAREVEMLSRSLELYGNPPKDGPDAWQWITVQGFASGVEKIYSGCERVMEMVASEFDQSKVDHTEGWHVSLLKRMAHPYPGVREAVISGTATRPSIGCAPFGTGSAIPTASTISWSQLFSALARCAWLRRAAPSSSFA